MSGGDQRENRFDRREFFKIGLAAGLVAGVPYLMPKLGARTAFAKVGRNTEGIAPPTVEELADVAQRYFLNISKEDLEVYKGICDGAIGSYRRVRELAEPKLPVKYPRQRGYRPTALENPFNAWYWKCDIKGANSGKLANKKIALKDNICLAGIPMMNGSAVLEGFVPDVDATVATRILDAGGNIVGKSVCEDLCFSGASFTSATGPVLNPHKKTHNAGGSSSGSAVLLVTGEVDMAMGGDQGGSIRIPSAWTGCYGLKPTHGLVPYTGVFPIESTLDHTGPMAMSAMEVALLLEVLAGTDGFDPRQYNVVTKEYTKSLDGSVNGMSFGVVKEGFGWEGASEEDVDEAVRDACGKLKAMGANVEEVSIPIHRDGIHIWNCVATEGALAQMVLHDGMGLNWQGYYTTSIVDYYGNARRNLADNFSDTVKFVILLGQYMADKYCGRYYAKAQNLVPVLTKGYDDGLAKYDLLVMPTIPMKATPIPKDPDTGTYFATALGMIQNTCPFDCTHHPAMNVPIAKSDGLPIGMMLIGKHYDDDKVLKAAYAIEKAGWYKG
jgi:amidase